MLSKQTFAKKMSSYFFLTGMSLTESLFCYCASPLFPDSAAGVGTAAFLSHNKGVPVVKKKLKSSKIGHDMTALTKQCIFFTSNTLTSSLSSVSRA